MEKLIVKLGNITKSCRWDLVDLINRKLREKRELLESNIPVAPTTIEILNCRIAYLEKLLLEVDVALDEYYAFIRFKSLDSHATK